MKRVEALVNISYNKKLHKKGEEFSLPDDKAEARAKEGHVRILPDKKAKEDKE